VNYACSDKREQLVRELRSLFVMLRENSRRSSIHMPKKNRRPEKYIVDFYDAFRCVTRDRLRRLAHCTSHICFFAAPFVERVVYPSVLSKTGYSNKEDGVVSLMIEYMDGGSLQDIVDMGGCDDEPTLANIAVQALKGLLFLHENYQIHRDLKPGASYINKAYGVLS
jgi:serine/threonine protein kinase